MKIFIKTISLILCLLITPLSYAAEEVSEQIWMGKKIYDRFYGRGCGTCHDISTNPNLAESIKKLTKEEFYNVLKHGVKGKMPPAINVINEMHIVKKYGYDENNKSLDAVYEYIKGRANGTIPHGKLTKIK